MPKEVFDQAAIDALKQVVETHPEYGEVVIGGVYEYCYGGRYRVINVHRSATRYEVTGETSFTVEYEQLYKGNFPKRNNLDT